MLSDPESPAPYRLLESCLRAPTPPCSGPSSLASGRPSGGTLVPAAPSPSVARSRHRYSPSSCQGSSFARSSARRTSWMLSCSRGIPRWGAAQAEDGDVLARAPQPPARNSAPPRKLVLPEGGAAGLFLRARRSRVGQRASRGSRSNLLRVSMEPSSPGNHGAHGPCTTSDKKMLLAPWAGRSSPAPMAWWRCNEDLPRAVLLLNTAWRRGGLSPRRRHGGRWRVDECHHRHALPQPGRRCLAAGPDGRATRQGAPRRALPSRKPRRERLRRPLSLRRAAPSRSQTIGFSTWASPPCKAHCPWPMGRRLRRRPSPCRKRTSSFRRLRRCMASTPRAGGRPFSPPWWAVPRWRSAKCSAAQSFRRDANWPERGRHAGRHRGGGANSGTAGPDGADVPR